MILGKHLAACIYHRFTWLHLAVFCSSTIFNRRSNTRSLKVLLRIGGVFAMVLTSALAFGWAPILDGSQDQRQCFILVSGPNLSFTDSLLISEPLLNLCLLLPVEHKLALTTKTWVVLSVSASTVWLPAVAPLIWDKWVERICCWGSWKAG